MCCLLHKLQAHEEWYPLTLSVPTTDKMRLWAMKGAGQHVQATFCDHKPNLPILSARDSQRHKNLEWSVPQPAPHRLKTARHTTVCKTASAQCSEHFTKQNCTHLLREGPLANAGLPSQCAVQQRRRGKKSPE